MSCNTPPPVTRLRRRRAPPAGRRNRSHLRYGFHQHVYLAPLRLWIELDAGTIQSVHFNPITQIVRLTLSPATSSPHTALLRLNQSAIGDLPTPWALTTKFSVEREAFAIPLKTKAVTIELHPLH